MYARSQITATHPSRAADITYAQRRLGGKAKENVTNLSVGSDRRSFSTEQQIQGTLQKGHYDRDWQCLHQRKDKDEKKATFVFDNQGKHRTFQREGDILKDHYSDGTQPPKKGHYRTPRNRTASVTHDRSKHYDYGFDQPSYTPTATEFLVSHPPITNPEIFAGKSPAWISPPAREMKGTHFQLGTDPSTSQTTSQQMLSSINRQSRIVPRAQIILQTTREGEQPPRLEKGAKKV